MRTSCTSWWCVHWFITSLGVHRGNGVDQQRGVGLGVLHKHQQQLQGCFHHQTELERRNTKYTITQMQKQYKLERALGRAHTFAYHKIGH